MKKKQLKKMKEIRQKYFYKFKENNKNKMRNEHLRLNKEYKEKEKKVNVIRNLNLRSHEKYKEREKKANVIRNLNLRSNEDYKTKEKSKNSKRIKELRLDYKYIKHEKIHNKLRVKHLRTNHVYKMQELKKNAEKIKTLRQKCDFKIKEMQKNKNRMKLIRSNTNYNQIESDKNKLRKRNLRLDELFKYRENFYNVVHCNLLLKNNPELKKYLIFKDYIESRKYGPEEVCICCDNLFYNKSMLLFDKTKIVNKLTGIINNIPEFILNVQNSLSDLICKTCYKHIIKGHLPKTAATENLRFHDLPIEITSLNDVEERMISPYIPFMQIRAILPYVLNPQLSLNGSIINIAIDINDMLKYLPRQFNNMSTIQIQLKRHNYKTFQIIEALDHLIESPLYIKHEIQIDRTFFNSYAKINNEEINFIVDEADVISDEEKNLMKIKFQQNNYEKQIAINEELDDIDNYEINDEILILDRNKEISEDIYIIAPGQYKRPLPWHSLEHIDELCFPRIFGGHIFDKDKKLTYSEKVKYESRHRDRRSCIPTRILFMAKKS